MRKKQFLIQSLISGAALVLSLKWLADRASRQKPGPGRSAQPSAYPAIDRYIEGQMQRLSIPGAALAIVDGDQIVHLRSFGRAYADGKAATPQTPFMIGSLTKSFTALAVMQLCEAGKIELDVPIQRYLPWFCLADQRSSARITVRHLLNQTSGLPMSAGLTTMINFESHTEAYERQARALSNLALAHPVGTTCEYSNLNYDLLGLIIEVASGEPYTGYVQNHIFNPLGMSHSYTSHAEGAQNGLAMGHRYWFGVPVAAPNLPVNRGSIASGWLISSIEDMARYLIAHINAGRLGDVQIVSEAGMRELHQGAAEYIKFGVSSGRYAMGWFDDKIGGTRLISHGGNLPDFSAYMGFLPDQKSGLVLLTNADHFGLPPILAEVGWGATTLLAGLQPQPPRLAFIPWVMRLLALIPLLQVMGVLAALQRIGRRDRAPALAPQWGQVRRRQLLLSLIPNLSLATLPVFFLSRGMLGFLKSFMPDVYWTALISGGSAGAWAFLKIVVILRSFWRNGGKV